MVDWTLFLSSGGVGKDRDVAGGVGGGGSDGGEKPSGDEVTESDGSCDRSGGRSTEQRNSRSDHQRQQQQQKEKEIEKEPTDRRLPTDGSTADQRTDRSVANHQHKDQPGEDRCACQRNNGGQPRKNGKACCKRRCNEQWSAERLARVRAAVPPLGIGQQQARKAHLAGCISIGIKQLYVRDGRHRLPVCYAFFSALTGYSKGLIASAMKGESIAM